MSLSKFAVIVCLLLAQTGVAFAQMKSDPDSIGPCEGFISPNPTCIRINEGNVWPDPQIEIDIDTLSLGGATASEIDRVELYRIGLIPGSPSTLMHTINIGSTWLDQTTYWDFNLVTAPTEYFFIAYCSLNPSVMLPISDTINSLRMISSIREDSLIDLTWNWDNVTTSSIVSLERKVPSSSPVWKQLDTVNFKPTALSYTDTFTDPKLIVAYRIIQYNTSKGCQSESPTLLVKPNFHSGVNPFGKTNSLIQLYPNPTKNKFTIDSGYEEIDRIFIYNSTGQLVLQKQLNGNSEIDVSGLEDGIYVVRCIEEKFNFSKKIVIKK